MAKMQYNTKQRTTIIEYMKGLSGGHVTAAEIQQGLLASGNQIGMATIYRQLEKLEQEGCVRKYSLDGSAGSCYQYVAGDQCCEHYHLKCEGCGKLIHLDCGMVNELHQHIEDEHGFHVNNRKTVLYGTCKKCR